ncbi:MAG TPA: ComEC/Rec2 family competence protein [Pyrinomonadaceae bacterium]|nr:ComEC/Rec2 family competence protein [Pyrinomonadaceae bacterium]
MNPHEASLSRHPLAQLAFAFAAGICAANYFESGLKVVWIAGGVCTVVALIAALTRRLRVAGAALLAATVCAGATLATQERRDSKPGEIREFVGKTVVITGVLVGPVEIGDALYLMLGVERLEVDGFTRISSGVLSLRAPAESHNAQLRYGARVRVVTTLSRSDNYQNPGVSTLAEYLDRKDLDATGIIKSLTAITLVEEAPSYSFLGWLYSWREKLQREIDTKFAPETAGVLEAALLGNRYNLSRESAERFREGGTFHVLVISGLHISFIGGIVLLIVKRLTRRRSFQFFVPVLVVWAYSLAVGAEASVVRAALMFTFAGFALVLFRESSSLNALGGSALVLLAHSPKDVLDPSFQLTFLSVLAIVAVAWPLLQTFAALGGWSPSRETPYPPACSRGLRWFCELLFWSERKWKKELARSPHRFRLFKAPLAAWLERYQVQRLAQYVFGAVLVSAAVQLVLLPLMIVYFHRLSPASLLLNIVVGVLLAVLTAVALLALLLSQLSATLALPLIKLANTINDLMVHSVDPFAHFNVASIRVPEYAGSSAFVYALYYVPLLVLTIALARWRPFALPVQRTRRWVVHAALTQVLLIAVLIFHPFSAGAEGKLRVDFLDVGQGDAALLTTRDGRTLLVDGGGRNTDKNRSKTVLGRGIGEAVVSEYLWWRGLDTVDYVLATHADADHIDGLNDVLRNFTVNAALVGRTPPDDPQFSKFAQTLSATSTPTTTLQAGDVIRFGDVAIHVLWPPAAISPNEPSRNDDSVVLRLTLGKRSILLTGDIEKSAERALSASAESLQADVVKVPHHGSRSSSTVPFVAATRPPFAIISVGQSSIFGHPHAEVVERWQASGAEVLTTGKCGTITVTTDGTDLTVTGMQNRTSQGSPCRAGR